MAYTDQQVVQEQNHSSNPSITFADLIKPTTSTSSTNNPIKLKPISFVQGEPSITFDSTDIETYIKEEKLQFAVILKFSNGFPDIHEIRKQFPQQFQIKGECNIGLLYARHFLVRFSLIEDFIKIYSKQVESIIIKQNGVGQEYIFRVQRWTTKFNPKEETPIALAWISFPGLPCQMFARQAIYSLASAIGKPLHVDKATADKTRPSTARVKVEVNLLSKLPDRVRMCFKDTNSGEMSIEWQTIKYDKLPKYCRTCKKQGHDDEQCRLNVHNEQPNGDIFNETEQVIGNKSQGDLRHKLNEQRGIAAVMEVQLEHQCLASKKDPLDPQKESLSQGNEEHFQRVQTSHRRRPNNRASKPKPVQEGAKDVNTFAVLNDDGREDEEGQVDSHTAEAIQKEFQRKQTAQATIGENVEDGETNGSGGNLDGSYGNFDGNDSSIHVGKGQQDNMSQQINKEIGKGRDNQYSSLNGTATPPNCSHSATTRKKIDVGENTLSNKVIGKGPTLSPIEGPTQRIQDKCNQNSGHGMRDHLKWKDTHALEPVPHNTKTNNERGPCAPNIVSSNAQNVNGHEVGPCVNQVDEHDQQNSNYSVSPSHSSNALIPTHELELMCKMQRLMNLHGTNIVTLDIVNKLTKQEHQIYLKMLRDAGYFCTSVAEGTEEQPTPPKERPPQQPKRVQPARSSISNSTRGK